MSFNNTTITGLWCINWERIPKHFDDNSLIKVEVFIKCTIWLMIERQRERESEREREGGGGDIIERKGGREGGSVT